MHKHAAQMLESETQTNLRRLHDHNSTEAADVTHRRRRQTSPGAALIVRRLLGFAIAVGMAYGLFHVVFRIDILAPVLAYAGPAKNGIEWVMDDPRRAWAALAVIVIPHISLYYMLFEERG